MILAHPLTPRNADGVLRVIIAGRISTSSQDEESIDSQVESAETWLRRVYRGPIIVEPLGEQASGWLANRDSMLVAQQLIESGKYDLVLATELREIYRNPAFHWRFAQDCVDNDVRFILIEEVVDTADENWETMMHTASLRAGLAVPETRRRVRRKATYSFSRGGMVIKVRYGYRRLTKDEAMSGAFGTIGLRIIKLPMCTATIMEMRTRVLRGESYVKIAEWLNDSGIDPGPYVKKKKWTARTVKDLLRDSILSGRRRFRNTLHQIIYKTGKHRSRLNPQGPAVQEYPELAHMTPEEHAELLAAMDAREKRGRKGQKKGRDNPLWNRPRKRSPWPGQHAVCVAENCRGLMYRYGKCLRCEHSFEFRGGKCWNHTQIYFRCVFATVLRWMIGVLDKYPQVREKLITVVWQEFELKHSQRQRLCGKFDLQVVELEKEKKRFLDAIRTGGKLESLVAELAIIEDKIKHRQQERHRLESQAKETTSFLSRDAVAANLLEAVTELAQKSLDFADVLRQLLPVFVIEPVQALDSGLVRPRARLTLRLDEKILEGQAVIEESVTLDLFEPPEHIKHLAACVAAREACPKKTLRVIAAELGIGYMTVKRSLAYHRLMLAEGLTDPYRELAEKPVSASRWKKRSG